MHQRIGEMALAAALLAGCSGEVGGPPKVDPQAGDGSGGAVAPGSGQAGSGVTGQGEQGGAVVSAVDNGDGTTTQTLADGTVVTVDENGEVVATTAPPGAAGDQPSTVVDSNCAVGTPETTAVPRLTNRQYDNTIRDLLGVDLQLSATTLQADSKGNMDARTWGSYQDAAATVAATILGDATARASVITCSTADAACAEEVITGFGAKVFRRPLEADEVSRYLALYGDSTLTEGGTFDEQLQVALQAMFQSPYFLTLAETSGEPEADVGGVGERFALNDYEIASRLSYLLWDTMPDAELMAAAAAGTLTQGTGLAEQAQRMLGDDRAKGLVERLHMNYMRMGPNTRWVGYARDGAKYPHYRETQIDAVAQETLAVANAVVFSGGSFEQLMTTTVGFVNADTAPLYGLDPAQFGSDLTQVDLGPARPGLLTRAGFLAANAYGNRTSPIHRGAFIMKEVLCTPMGNPSPDAASTPLPDDAGLVTNRQKTAAQTSIGPDCIACHETIVNPPGFALESFDAVGGIQTTDNGEPIDTSAEVIVGSRVVPVAGPVDLMNAIATSPDAKRCYAENWVTVAYNRVLAPEDACTVDAIANNMAQDPSYALTSLITDLATVESFRYRAHETEVSQ